MKNLIKALGIIGLIGASFLPMKNVRGQTEIDSIKFCVYGEDRDSIFVTKYFPNSSKKHKIKIKFKKNEQEYYEAVFANTSKIDKSTEQSYNLFFYSKGYWTSGGEYIYNRDLNLIRICAKINGPKLVN